ncbi:SCO1/SenC-domain-containing protein [Phyllosticta citriasiana]|uniref:SCO1/SenC-domain-containing protein n=1 Tax=Phyllosticta citriasiana TaxID=595635 RepID=A0ABR1KIR9_9PEZI
MAQAFSLRPALWNRAIQLGQLQPHLGKCSAYRLAPREGASARRFPNQAAFATSHSWALRKDQFNGTTTATSIHVRSFSSSPSAQYKTVQEARSRYRAGPFTLTSAVLFFAVGAGLVLYFRFEKQRVERQRIAEQTKGVGRPKVGGPFELVDQNGKKFTSEDMKGKYALVYFGFSHCPDICPEELDKMAEMIDRVKKTSGNTLRPVFITCDPARDTPAVLKTYLNEFHPDIIGLTGAYDDIKDICKKYRVYFSTPPDVKPGQDYLVDHSIYFYLMDPEGDFVEALGRNEPASRAAKIISDHIGDWRGRLDKD